MAISVSGTEGALWWAWHVPAAAILRDWTLTPRPEGITLSGTVVSSDAFAVSQQPLTFATPKGLAWPIRALQIEGTSLTAVCGPPEVLHGG